MMKPNSLLLILALLAPAAAQAWKPVSAPLDTPWTSKVDPNLPLPEHPRPDFQRSEWKSLNGLWDYQLEPVDFQPMQGFIDRPSMTTGQAPSSYTGQILVPFAIDSPLSGVMHVLRPQERLWYRRSFEIPDAWKGRRIRLHFEASDWETGIYVNGRRIGQHRGGYDPFTFDISDALKPGENSLVVAVWDGTEQHCQPVGKQIMPENRQGFRYQPTGGIWQSVWLEAVDPTHLLTWEVTPTLTGFDFSAQASSGTTGAVLRVTVDGRDLEWLTDAQGHVSGHFNIPNPRHWSPDSPHLYPVKLQLAHQGRITDQVESYVGLRTLGRAPDGTILLNGQKAPLQFGPLDQGYWPDGILTPPHEDAIRFDLEYLKSIGCNMVRVHIKVHPRRWYYHADRLGLLVWQDMICTPKYGQTVDAAGSANWRREFGEILHDFHNHPSIIQWVVFNEAWGQHDTVKQTRWAEREDPSRLILSVSGWNDHGVGDVLDVHNYQFYPSAPTSDGFGNKRALFFGELGGHNLLLPGKQWYPDQENKPTVALERAGGRMNFASLEDLAVKYPFYLDVLRHFVARQGYQGFVYTQITDVEHECNGWMTYDRRTSKLPPGTLKKLHASLSHPLSYQEILGEGEWLAGRVPALKRGPKEQHVDWPDLRRRIQLPHQGEPLAKAQPRLPSLGLQHGFELKTQPKHLVLEVQATHQQAHAEPPAPRLDGHHPRAAANVPFITYLDGKLHRRGVVMVEEGQGQGVTYLEFTPAELSALKPGSHQLEVEILKPAETTGFTIRLLSYEK